MNDTEVKKFMAERLNAGDSLSDIQKMLDTKFKRKMTFLEVRLLASELENIEWEKPEEPAVDDAVEEEDSDPDAVIEPEITDGKTLVEVSKLVRPGAAASGSVKFASGASAEWIVDQTGRLGLEKVNGEPTEEDLKDFQQELQKAFSRR